MASGDFGQVQFGGVLTGVKGTEEKARVAFLLLVGIAFFDPVTAYAHRAASALKTGTDGADGRNGGCADVDAPVLALGAYGKKGEPSKASLAA